MLCKLGLLTLCLHVSVDSEVSGISFPQEGGLGVSDIHFFSLVSLCLLDCLCKYSTWSDRCPIKMSCSLSSGNFWSKQKDFFDVWGMHFCENEWGSMIKSVTGGLFLTFSSPLPVRWANLKMNWNCSGSRAAAEFSPDLWHSLRAWGLAAQRSSAPWMSMQFDCSRSVTSDGSNWLNFKSTGWTLQSFLLIRSWKIKRIKAKDL